MRSGAARLVIFIAAALALVATFAAIVRSTGVRSPLGFAAVLAIEVAAIACALGFHLLELPSPPPGRAPRREPPIDYL